MLVDYDAGMASANQVHEVGLALLDGNTAQVFAVELDQIEGAKDGGAVMRQERSRSNAERPRLSTTMASPSMKQERTLSLDTASTICGKRPAKSYYCGCKAARRCRRAAP
jgi:hypothetical protein